MEQVRSVICHGGAGFVYPIRLSSSNFVLVRLNSVRFPHGRASWLLNSYRGIVCVDVCIINKTFINVKNKINKTIKYFINY